MALDLNGYIKQSYERPNRKILEGLGASEDLIEYLMETPENTNWNVIEDLMNKNEDEDNVDVLNIYFDNRLCLIADSELETAGLSNPTPKEIYDFCELHNITVGQYLQSTNVVIYIIPPWPIEEPTNYVLEKDPSEQWGFITQDYYWYVDSSGIITWGSDN